MEVICWRVIITLTMTLLFGLCLYLIPQLFGSPFDNLSKEEDFLLTHFRNQRIYYNARKYSSPANDAGWKTWWNKWYQTEIKYGGNGKYLCISPKKKLFDCSSVESPNYACIDTQSGTIGICDFSRGTEHLLPLCKDQASGKIITCEYKDPKNVCFSAQNRTKANFPARLCADSKLHLCLAEDCSLDTCSNSSDDDDVAPDVNWSIFWSEWLHPKNEATHEKSGVGALCMDSQSKTVLCGSHTRTSELCVGVASGEVGICNEMKDTGHLVHICLMNSTTEIVTCGNSAVANLCFPSSEKLRPLRPCLSKSRQICLLDGGVFGNCSDATRETAFPFATKTTETVKDTAEERIVVENGQKGLIQLCKNDSQERVHKCKKNSLPFAACLNVKDGSIKTCYELESKADFGIPICIQKNTSSLVTCEMFSHSNLCLHHRGERFQLSQCRKPSRFACVTGKGSLKFCSSKKKHKKKGNSSSGDANYTLPMKYDSFELKIRSIVYICKANEEQDLVQCSGDAHLQVACLNLKDGKIDLCKSMEYSDLSIPVCVMGSKKYVVTCGKFNLVPVCLSAENGSPKHISCASSKNISCLNSRGIQLCNGIFRSHGVNGHSKSTREAENIKLPYSISRFSHKKKVYDAEMKSIESITMDRERLCLNKGATDKYSLCIEDPDLNFACLSIPEGRIKNCEDFEATQLAIPICVEKSGKVTTCGKFSKNPVCMYNVLDDILMTGCAEEGNPACLSGDGTFEECSSQSKNHGTQNDSGANSNDGSQEGEAQNAIREEILEMVKDSHQENMMLCVKGDKQIQLMNCDEEPTLSFACLGAVQGTVRKCSSYKEDFPVAVCARLGTYFFFTCDIVSKAPLCFSKKATSTYIFPCEDPDQRSCVTKEGYLDKCVEHRGKVPMSSGSEDSFDDEEEYVHYIPYDQDPTVVTGGNPTEGGQEFYDYQRPIGKPMAYKISNVKEAPTPAGVDEKFFRFYCDNCSIDHKFIIVGTPDDVYPQAEVITFPKDAESPWRF